MPKSWKTQTVASVRLGVTCFSVGLVLLTAVKSLVVQVSLQSAAIDHLNCAPYIETASLPLNNLLPTKGAKLYSHAGFIDNQTAHRSVLVKYYSA